LFSVGATCFILSGMGTDPLDVFCIGVQNLLGLKIGTTQSLFALGCLGVWSGLNKWKLPPFSTWLTFFICGYLIDFFLFLTTGISVHSIIALLSGLILCLQGSAGIISSGFGIRAMDLVALSLESKFGIKFWISKAIFETLLLTIGWLLGGPVGIGTIGFLIAVGYLVKPMVILNDKILRYFS